MSNKNKKEFLDDFVISSNEITKELIDFLVFTVKEDNTMRNFANSFSEDILNGYTTPEDSVKEMIDFFLDHYNQPCNYKELN